MNASTDRIERKILLKASRSRVWQALANAEEFGKWFGVAFKEKTFAPGQRVQGKVTCQGYEHVGFDVVIERMEPERLFSWRWHPYPVDPSIDYSKEPTTLVVFELEEVEEGTLLTVVESGFDAIPPSRRLQAFRMHSTGWDEQMKNIENHVAHRNASPKKALVENSSLQDSVPIFAALGDETRLRLIAVLCSGGAASIKQLTSGTEITRQAVTKHLRVLADAGLVRDTKVGRERLWEFESGQLEEARHSLDVISRQWDHAPGKLKMAVEGDEQPVSADSNSGSSPAES
jgi:DNA-binding transcriptional ArsR family regulator/uncharacterized protein YndB with AHSA1/START domain